MSSTKNFPCGLKPKAETLLVSRETMTRFGIFLVTVSVVPAVITVADGEPATSPSTCGSTNRPVFVHAQVSEGTRAAISTDTSTALVTPPALVPVILNVNVPGEGVAVVVTVSIVTTKEVDGTESWSGATVTFTPAGAAPVQSAVSCTLSPRSFNERNRMFVVFLSEATSLSDGGAADIA